MSYASGVLPNLTTAYQAVPLTGTASRTVWTLTIDTATSLEAYGIDLTVPAVVDIGITSDSDATKVEIADALATAWNANATCAYYATAVSDGVDTVTFTGASNTAFTIAKDENAAKMTLVHAASDPGDVESVNIPFGAAFRLIALWFGSVGSDTEVTWYLSADPDGLWGLTAPYTSEIDSDTHQAFAAVEPLKMDRLSVVTEPGRVYLQIKSDASDGMDLAVGRIFW